MSRPALGILLTVLAMCTLAFADAIAKTLTTLAPLMMIVWVRYLVFISFGSASALREHGVAGLRSKRPLLQLARGLSLVTANVAVVYCFYRLPLADVHAVLAIGPLLVMVAAVLMLSEKVSADRWLAISFGFVGILIIVRPASSVFDPFSLLTLVGAVMFGVYQVFTRMLSAVESQSTSQFYTGAIGFVCFSIIVVFWWDSPPLWVWGLMLIGGAINVFSHVLIITGLHLAPASTVQPFYYVMFVAAIWFGYLFFDELPDRYTIIGAIMVIAGGLYSFYRERQDAAVSAP